MHSALSPFLQSVSVCVLVLYKDTDMLDVCVCARICVCACVLSDNRK